MKSLIYARNNPYLTLLYLGMAGSVILFLVVLMAYANRVSDPNWRQLPMPAVFFVSTFTIMFSSFTLTQAVNNYKQESFDHYKNWMGFTLVLGVIFMISQVAGWVELLNQQLTFQNSMSAAFLYLLSGLHAAHVLGGLIVLILVYKDAGKNETYIDGFISSLNPIKASRLSLLVIYWHFVDVLWLALFLVFVLSA